MHPAARPAQTRACPVWNTAVRIAALLLATSPVAAGRGQSPPEPPAAALQRLLARLPTPGAVCGAAVAEADTGRVLYESDAHRSLIPASNAKIFVLAAAIDSLGADFEFRTVLARRGEDLVVVGDGDPALGDPAIAELKGEPIPAVFDRWADALRQANLARLEGNLILDESIFDEQWYHPDWDKGDGDKWYGAPVGALNFNDNCIDVTVRPGAPGSLATYEVVPATTIVKIANRCTSERQGQPTLARRGLTFEYALTGRCSKQVGLQSAPVPDPGLFFASVLRTALAERGIVIAGGIRRQRVRDATGCLPPDCRIIAEHRTPLSEVTARVGKNSQNLFAECLLKRLGYEWARRNGRANPVGSWETGRCAILDFLSRAGVDPADVTISDASGLSRANRATAAAFVRVLVYMQHRPGWEAFVRSLSVAGRDGSLRKRMKDVPGVVCAKTGYIRGVRTLSGYVETRDKRLYCFSVVFNGIKGSTAPYNRIHDEVCRVLAAGPAK